MIIVTRRAVAFAIVCPVFMGVVLVSEIKCISFHFVFNLQAFFQRSISHNRRYRLYQSRSTGNVHVSGGVVEREWLVSSRRWCAFFWDVGTGAMLLEWRRFYSPYPGRYILEAYQHMMAMLKGYQDASGMWKQMLDDPESWNETSDTAMLCYAMDVGVKSVVSIDWSNGWTGIFETYVREPIKRMTANIIWTGADWQEIWTGNLPCSGLHWRWWCRQISATFPAWQM